MVFAGFQSGGFRATRCQGFEVVDFEFRVEGLGFRAQVSGFRVWGDFEGYG